MSGVSIRAGVDLRTDAYTYDRETERLVAEAEAEWSRVSPATGRHAANVQRQISTIFRKSFTK